jgi:tungstate transport system permease protein
MWRLLGDVGRAFWLIVTGDAEVWQVTAVSLEVSVAALALATLTGVPVGYAVASAARLTAHLGSWVLHTLAALPTVVVGLTLYFVLSASGPLGWLDVLYTRVAMVIGQVVLAMPLVAALTYSAVRRLPPEARETVTTLGLGRLAAMAVLVRRVSAWRRRCSSRSRGSSPRSAPRSSWAATSAAIRGR